jgi:hypothetical protein
MMFKTRNKDNSSVRISDSDSFGSINDRGKGTSLGISKSNSGPAVLFFRRATDMLLQYLMKWDRKMSLLEVRFVLSFIKKETLHAFVHPK